MPVARLAGGPASPCRRQRSKTRPGATPSLLLLAAALFVLPSLSMAQSAAPATAGAPPVCPPKARVDAVREDIHGATVADPYRWLEDQTSPETRAWIDAENQCTKLALDGLPQRPALQKRLGELMRVDSPGIPVERNGRLFFLYKERTSDLGVLYYRDSLTGKNHLLVDPQTLSADHSINVTLEGVSQDGKYVYYGLRQGGRDEVTVHIKDVDTLQDLKDTLPSAAYFGIAPLLDNSGLYYSRATSQGPRVYLHTFGSDPAPDKEVFGAGYGTDKIIAVNQSEGGDYLLIMVAYGSSFDHTEIYTQDLRRHGLLVPIVKDIVAGFAGDVAGDTLYLYTNWNAPQGRVIAVDLTHPRREHWRDVIPEGDAPLETAVLSGGKIVALYTHQAASMLKIFDADGSHGHEIPLPALGSVFGVAGRWSSPNLFFGFESFAYPPAVFYTAAAGTAPPSSWMKSSVPIHSEDYLVTQVYYESKDRTRIPMFIFYKKGLRIDGNNPTLMTGYGGFAVSETPSYKDYAVAWVEQGGVFAVPNMRGGGEFGEAWHHAGMRENKQNVFDDFIGGAEYLIAHKFTSSDHLAIWGRSNGGLLVGAALTQRPDLFRAVICGYPLLDMLRYQKFMDGPYWVPEYGSADQPDALKWLYAYSPYHHVADGRKYPAVLFITGDGDTRVAPLHARKMTARLQAATISGLPVLLLYDTEAGHSDEGSVEKQIVEYTNFLAFLDWQLSITTN
jgi:prolyl oligopeptidase